MAQYKVPQDVEADDKLLGPFSFRQFVYLLIAGGLVALAVLLFQLFPLLAIIPIPPIILLVVLALPIKKDQPMETYLAALVSYYLKPRTRLWTAGQRDSVIKITAPKVVEESRVRNISGEEANHRLSFLADIVDTGGYSIKGGGNSAVREDLVAEANSAKDMFEGYHFDNLNNVIQKDETARHQEVVKEMQEVIKTNNNISTAGAKIQKRFEEPEQLVDTFSGQTGASLGGNMEDEKFRDLRNLTGQTNLANKDIYSSPVVVVPGMVEEKQEAYEKNSTKSPKPSIIELANNADFSVETIAKEAKRINERDGEVFISLH